MHLFLFFYHRRKMYLSSKIFVRSNRCKEGLSSETEGNGVFMLHKFSFYINVRTWIFGQLLELQGKVNKKRRSIAMILQKQ